MERYLCKCSPCFSRLPDACPVSHWRPSKLCDWLYNKGPDQVRESSHLSPYILNRISAHIFNNSFHKFTNVIPWFIHPHLNVNWCDIGPGLGCCGQSEGSVSWTCSKSEITHQSAVRTLGPSGPSCLFVICHQGLEPPLLTIIFISFSFSPLGNTGSGTDTCSVSSAVNKADFKNCSASLPSPYTH